MKFTLIYNLYSSYNFIFCILILFRIKQWFTRCCYTNWWILSSEYSKIVISLLLLFIEKFLTFFFFLIIRKDTWKNTKKMSNMKTLTNTSANRTFEEFRFRAYDYCSELYFYHYAYLKYVIVNCISSQLYVYKNYIYMISLQYGFLCDSSEMMTK